MTTIADVLGGAGYQTAAVVSNSVLVSESIGLDRRFEHYDDSEKEREGIRPVWERRAGPTTDAALSWLEKVRRRDEPFFLWVHYNDPHGPYDPPGDKPSDYEHDGGLLVSRRQIPAYIPLADDSYAARVNDVDAFGRDRFVRVLRPIEPDDVSPGSLGDRHRQGPRADAVRADRNRE